MSRYLAALVGVLLPLAGLRAQQPPTPVPPGTPVTITVTPAAPAAPPASITLGPRHGHVVPYRAGFTHTGGGNIDIAQPTPDVVVVTMTGVAVAGPHPCNPSVARMQFDLTQGFEVTFDNPKLKKAKLVAEARVTGLTDPTTHTIAHQGPARPTNVPAAHTMLPAAHTKRPTAHTKSGLVHSKGPAAHAYGYRGV